MNPDQRRITLVTRSASTPDRDWCSTRSSQNRMIFIEAFTVLRYALASGVSEMSLDIDRVILDRSTSPAEFLDLLTQLPSEFHGDVMLIRADDSGFLSASARGGNRVLYAMSAPDLRFYLETNGLVSGRSALTALAA